MTGTHYECQADSQEEEEENEVDEQDEEEEEAEEDECGVHSPDSTDDDTYNPRDVKKISSSSEERPPAKSKVGAICVFVPGSEDITESVPDLFF